MVAAVVVIIEEEEVVCMVTVEEEGLGIMTEGEVMTITVEGVGLVAMIVGEVVTIVVEGVVLMMVEVVVHIEVVKVEKIVAMVNFLLLMPSLMVVLVETTHPLTILMAGTQVMEQMLFLHLQVILVGLIPILRHMGVAWVVMVEIVKGMDGVVVDLGLLLDMTIVTVLVLAIEVDLVGLLLSHLLQ